MQPLRTRLSAMHKCSHIYTSSPYHSTPSSIIIYLPFLFSQFDEVRTSKWMFQAFGPHHCSAADYSIPHYYNTHWTFQSYITGILTTLTPLAHARTCTYRSDQSHLRIPYCGLCHHTPHFIQNLQKLYHAQLHTYYYICTTAYMHMCRQC